MSQEEYIKNRVDVQISWNDVKSSKNRALYGICTIISIVGSLIVSASIPFCKTIAIILSLLVAIAVGVNNSFKFHQKWKLYRLTAELLNREKLLFLTKVKDYGKENAFDIFVQRIEDILSSSNGDWAKILDEPTDKNDRNNGTD